MTDVPRRGVLAAKVVPLLAESGRRAIAVDLPGHGVSARFPAAYLQPGQPGLAEEVSPLRELTLDTVAPTNGGIRRARAIAFAFTLITVGHSLAVQAMRKRPRSASASAD
jgi:pimeloyl-ACP methyl ester carboxylesterase